MKVAFFISLAIAAPLWCVALVSHLSGNETAMNALIGIPLGVAFWLGLYWAMDKWS